MNIILIANGALSDVSVLMDSVNADDYIICVDGGLNHIYETKLIPNLIIGDLDSAKTEIVEYYRKKGVEIETYPKHKDYTDLELAITSAIARNPEKITIFGALGGRMDHTFANIANMKLIADANIYAVLKGDDEDVYIVKNKIVFEKAEGKTISLIALSDIVEGVTTKGLMYPLVSENLYSGFSRGVSNEVIDEESSVEIKSGYLIVIMNK